MGILGAARERSIVALADGILQICADFVPALAEIDLTRPAEDAIGKVGRTEAGEADQLLLFLSGGRTLVRLDFGREPDRSDVVAGAFLPAPCETTVACEKKFEPRSRQGLEGALAMAAIGVAGAGDDGSGSSSGSKFPAKAVTPRPRPDERAVLPKRSMVKGSSCDMIKLLGLWASAITRATASAT